MKSKATEAAAFKADPPARETSPRTDAFVCYSRQDKAFAAGLVTGLRDAGKTIAIDIDDIRGGDVWRRKIQHLIELAGSVLLIISPDSLKSQYCRWELDFANTLGKRLVSVVARAPDGIEIPASVASVQWIDSTSTAQPGGDIVAAVAKALEEDQTWTEFHTRLLLRTLAWEHGRTTLLRGGELANAESLLLAHAGRRPSITASQSSFLIASRRAARRRAYAGGLAALIVALGIGFGASTWLSRQDEAGRRGVEQAAASLATKDVIGAVEAADRLVEGDPLRVVSARRSSDWLRAARDVSGLWGARLLALADVVKTAATPALILLNDKPVLKTQSGQLVAVPALSHFLLRDSPALKVLVHADARGVSLRDRETFASLLFVASEARSLMVAVHQAPVSQMLLVAAERLVVNNKEDAPRSLFIDLYLLRQLDGPREPALCSELVGKPAAPCTWIRETDGAKFTAAVMSLPENHRIDRIAESDGSVVVDTRLDCEFVDECRNRALTTRARIGVKGARLVVEIVDGSQPLAPGDSLELPSLPESRFPGMKPESAVWRARLVPAPRVGETPKSRALDFSRWRDDEHDRYEALLTESQSLHFVPSNQGGGTVWTGAAGGNTWLFLIGCRHDEAYRIVGCHDRQIAGVDEDHIFAPDARYMAQRHCESGRPSILLVDMLTNEEVDLGVLPQGLVFGIAFDSTGRRLAALTDQNELWIYDVSVPVGRRFSRKIALTGAVSGAPATSCVLGLPIAFIGSRHVVGLDSGRTLFRANVEVGLLDWLSRPLEAPAAAEERAVKIAANPDGSRLALWDASGVRIYQGDWGFPLTEPVKPVDVLPKFDFNSIAFADDGSLIFTCSIGPVCGSAIFTREHKTLSSSCLPKGLLTGRDGASNRSASEAELLGLLSRTAGPCAR